MPQPLVQGTSGKRKQPGETSLQHKLAKVTNEGKEQAALQHQIAELQKKNDQLQQQIAWAAAGYKSATEELHQRYQSGQAEYPKELSGMIHQPSKGEAQAASSQNDAENEQAINACKQAYETMLATLAARCEKLQQKNQQLQQQHVGSPKSGQQAGASSPRNAVNGESPVQMKLEALLHNSKVPESEKRKALASDGSPKSIKRIRPRSTTAPAEAVDTFQNTETVEPELKTVAEPTDATKTSSAVTPLSSLDITDLALKLREEFSGKNVSLNGKSLMGPAASSPRASEWLDAAVWPQNQNSALTLAALPFPKPINAITKEELLPGDNNVPEAPLKKKSATKECLMTPPDEMIKEGFVSDACGAGKDPAEDEHVYIRSSMKLAVVSAVPGSCISNGRMALSESSAIIFDNACGQFTLKDLEFSGGLIICHGEGCKVDFINVSFISCSLVVAAGAQASLRGCSFFHHEDRSSIIASGTATNVSVSETTVARGHHGLLVQLGAAVTASNLNLSNITHSTAVVRGADSRLTLEHCKLEQTARGVLVSEQAECALKDCSLSHARVFALKVQDSGSRCTATKTHFTNPTDVGVVVTDGGGLHAEGCVSVCYHPKHSSTAFVLCSEHSYALMNDCSVTGHERGCEVTDNAKLTAHRLTVEGCRLLALMLSSAATAAIVSSVLGRTVVEGQNTSATFRCCTMKLISGPSSISACLSVSDKATADLMECSCCDEEKQGQDAIAVSGEGSKVVAQGVTIEDGFGTGLVLQNGAAGVLRNCSINDSYAWGVRAQGSKATLDMMESTVARSQGTAVLINMGAKATLSCCKLCQAHVDGLHVEGSESQVTATECSIENNRRAGVHVDGAKSVLLKQCTLNGNQKFKVWDPRNRKQAVEKTAPSKRRKPVKARVPHPHPLNTNSATRRYADAIAAALHESGPMTVSELQSRVSRPSIAMGLSKVIEKYACFQAVVDHHGEATVSLRF